ncbi:RsbRD N-terminal domain-containing protein [Desulfococcaceae bacterium HSG9]|nr:RsbRD N-terminal domain-containing protein [Desulfococcaceae bacterium HSG9]
MKLSKLLIQHKAEVVKKWFDYAVQSYKADVAQFLKTQGDQFANPVGGALSQNLEPLFNELCGQMNTEALTASVDPIVRIRAVQSFAPSQAVAFIFSLKRVIRTILKKELRNENLLQQLYEFDLKIDVLGLIAFDAFMVCREKIYDLKANEMRNRTLHAFERAKLVKNTSLYSIHAQAAQPITNREGVLSKKK